MHVKTCRAVAGVEMHFPDEHALKGSRAQVFIPDSLYFPFLRQDKHNFFGRQDGNIQDFFDEKHPAQNGLNGRSQSLNKSIMQEHVEDDREDFAWFLEMVGNGLFVDEFFAFFFEII